MSSGPRASVSPTPIVFLSTPPVTVHKSQLAFKDTTSAEALVPHLVGRVFDTATPQMKCALVDALLRPLGALSVVAVAGGVFGKIRFHPHWPHLEDDPDIVSRVSSTDIVALVNHAQQVSFAVLDNLARVVDSSPAMTYSAAAALLTPILIRSQKQRAVLLED